MDFGNIEQRLKSFIRNFSINPFLVEKQAFATKKS